MAGSRRGWWIVGGVAAGSLALIGWQRYALAADRASWRGQDAEVRRLQAENRRLSAAQVSAAEQARRQSDQAEMARLRAEIETLRTRKVKGSTTATVPKPEPPTVPSTAWSDAGRGTPAAALETALWAAAGGDIDVLAALLTFEPVHRPMVDALFARLSEETRAQYVTPERLMALFTAKDIPLGAMQIREQKQAGADDATLVVRLRTTEGTTKDSMLSLRRADDGWRLIVPLMTVQKYGAALGVYLGSGVPGSGENGKSIGSGPKDRP